MKNNITTYHLFLKLNVIGSKVRDKFKNLGKNESQHLGALAGWYQQICSGIGGLIVLPTLINTLGMEITGIWLTLQSVIVIMSLSDFGFSMVLSRQVAHTFNMKSEVDHLNSDLLTLPAGWEGVSIIFRASQTIFSSIGIAILLIMIISYELFIIFYEFNISYLRAIWYMVAISFYITFITKLRQNILDGIGFLYINRFLGGSYLLINSLLSILVLKYGFGLLGLSVILIITSLLHFYTIKLAFKIIVSKNITKLNFNKKKIISKLLKISLPFGVVNIGGFLVTTAQIPLLGILVSASLIPALYIAIKISQILNGMVQQIITAQLPSFTKELAQGAWPSAATRMRSYIFIGITLQLFATFFLYFISPILVEWWVGPNKYISNNVLMYFTINYLITTIVGLPALFVLASGRNPFANSTILHGVIGLAGMLILCPDLGILGVPISGIISILVTNFWINSYQGWKTYKTITNKF